MRQWLADSRARSGMTMTKVALAAGITPQAYSYIENGDRNPSVPTAQKIASVLGFDWTEFFEKEESA